MNKLKKTNLFLDLPILIYIYIYIYIYAYIYKVYKHCLKSVW